MKWGWDSPESFDFVLQGAASSLPVFFPARVRVKCVYHCAREGHAAPSECPSLRFLTRDWGS